MLAGLLVLEVIMVFLSAWVLLELHDEPKAGVALLLRLLICPLRVYQLWYILMLQNGVVGVSAGFCGMKGWCSKVPQCCLAVMSVALVAMRIDFETPNDIQTVVTYGNGILFAVDLPMMVYVISLVMGCEESEIEESEIPPTRGREEAVVSDRVPAQYPVPLIIDLTENEEEVSRSCAICLAELLPGDDAQKLPCEHAFHTGCITQWLLRNSSCPLRCPERVLVPPKIQQPVQSEAAKQEELLFVLPGILVFLMVGETFVVTMLLLIVSQDGPTSFGFGNAGILRLFRLLRLTRMARMLRSMPELMILIKGMAAATTSVFFIMCLQLILLYVFAIAFTQLAADTQMGAYYFPNVLHSMYTLLLYGTFLDNLSSFCDEVGAESGLCLALIFIFVLLSACTVLNMLIGILCEVVNTVTTVEKEEMTVLFVTNKLQKVLDELDSNNDGQLSKEEFEHILQVPAAARALEEVGVDPVSIVDCGNFIFGEGGGTDLPFKKFMEVLLTLRSDNKCTLRYVISLRGQVKNKLDSLVHQLCADLPIILGLRNKVQAPHSRQQTGDISMESAERELDSLRFG
eukprot:s126_g44.t1